MNDKCPVQYVTYNQTTRSQENTDEDEDLYYN